MIFNKSIENIILKEFYFKIYFNGNDQQIFYYEKLDKVYISVHKKSINYIIIRTIVPILLLFLSMRYLNLHFSLFLFTPLVLLLTIKMVNYKHYLFVIKFKTGDYQEFIVMPKLKLRLIDKMRNVRAAIAMQKFQK